MTKRPPPVIWPKTLLENLGFQAKDTRSKVVPVPVVVALTAVGRPGQIKAHARQLIRGDPGLHPSETFIIIGSQAGGRSNLEAVGLPWWRVQGVAHAQCDGQVGPHAPDVLEIEFILVRGVFATHWVAVR